MDPHGDLPDCPGELTTARVVIVMVTGVDASPRTVTAGRSTFTDRTSK
ncbi:hypothetical protein [Mobilicoccus massiliensis]|nr:hypothetical protein [Mobilicoccus massiliensis]